ncbi:hypothetical protein ACJZ2D_017163 [Fusarium nematophilum]
MYGNSRLFRKVDEFLTQDLLISPDGLPHSPLWSGLQEEPGVVNSLRSIVESRNSLRDIQNEFLQFIEEAKRERKNHHVDEQQTFSRQLQQFTVATLVLGILNLVAQLYSGRPERGDSSAWAGFLIIVMLSVTIGGCTLVILFWVIVSSPFATLSRWLLRLPPYLQRVPQTAQDSINFPRSLAGGLGGFIIFLRHYLSLGWDYVGIARLYRPVRRLFRRRNGAA